VKVQLITTLATALALPSSAVQPAQSRVSSVLSVEDQRVEAMRTGNGVAPFYAAGYRGITAHGQYETTEQLRVLKADPGYARMNDVVVEVHDDTAIVTCMEGSNETDLDLALRIWTWRDGKWTIVTGQTTWIGNRANAPPPSGPLPNTHIAPFKPATAQAESVWRSQDALMQAFSNADPDTYRTFSTEKSLRMTTAGDPITRDTWLNTLARRQKAPPAVVDEVKIATYGSVAVVNLRGHEANPTRQTWVYLKQDGLWKLHLRYTSLIRN
jgi:hypothetical protein